MVMFNIPVEHNGGNVDPALETVMETVPLRGGCNVVPALETIL